MAALDFPASPTNGQVFSAPNGVTYIYSSAYTAWQAQPLSAGFVGDCSAYTPGAGIPGMAAGATVVVTGYTVLSGNAGGWLNTSNGRFTPPKGRYQLIATVGMFSSSSLILSQSAIRKNGTQIPGSLSNSCTDGANHWLTCTSLAIVDANGTDYFDMTAYGHVAASGSTATFMAIPISPNANMVQGAGDFYATYTTAGWTAGAGNVMAPPVVTGNSGGYYNTSNGRFTPPAGRYFLFASAQTGNTAAQSLVDCYIRKNGTTYLANTRTATAGAGQPGGVAAECYVDANGTDYFEAMLFCNAASNVAAPVSFGAFPISGIKGPQGDPPPGSPLYLYSEQVLSVAGNVLAVTIPPLAKLVQLEWGTTNGGGANDNLWLQMMQSGVPLNAANYEFQEAYGSGASAGGVSSTGQVGWMVNHGHTSSGWFKTSYLPSALGGFAGGYVMGNGQYFEIQTGGARVMRTLSTFYNAAITGGLASITGFRLTPQTTNLVAGSYLRAFVVT